jgi:drug/metabolite transporter (DMT)-like permease
MGGIEALWKLLLVVLLYPFIRIIPCPEVICEGGQLENVERVLELFKQDRTLLTYVLVTALLAASAQFLGMAVIKEENAVHKITISLAMVAIVWIFFMSWPYAGHESFSWLMAVGIAFIFVGSFWFVYADRQNKEGITLMDGRALR